MNIKDYVQQEQAPINAAMSALVEELPPLARPVARHVFEAGGKRLRPVLTLMCGRALGCEKEALYRLGCSIEILHAATLLHDDIMDNALLRRGKPAAHTCFDQTRVILSGDLMLAKALSVVAEFDDVRLTASLSGAVMKTAEGQMEEMASLRDTSLPYEGYLSTITGKTAWLLRTSCALGAIYAGGSEADIAACATFGLELGIAFQLVDDALDVAPAQVTGKPSGGDILEGKITPPLLLYMDSLAGEERERFQAAFAAGAVSRDLADAVCAAIMERGFADQTRAMAREHAAKAAKALAGLPEGREKTLLAEMAAYIVTREK